MLAYEIYYSTLEECKKLRNSRDLIDKIAQKESYTINQLDNQIHTKVYQSLKEIEGLKNKEEYSLIIEKCEHFFHFIQPYPKTDVIKREQTLIIQQYDTAIERSWEEQYKETNTKIKDLIKKGNNTKAIGIGKDFITSSEKYSSVKSMRIFRDGIIGLIEAPITQMWQEKYQKVKQEVKNLGTRKQFQDAYKKMNLFLLETEEDKDIDGVNRLRERIQRRYTQVRTLEPQITKREDYENLVAKAQENYESKEYEKAIYYTDAAIELVKTHNLEEKEIFLKDTRTHVTLVRFKFLCEDKFFSYLIVSITRFHLIRQGVHFILMLVHIFWINLVL